MDYVLTYLETLRISKVEMTNSAVVGLMIRLGKTYQRINMMMCTRIFEYVDSLPNVNGDRSAKYLLWHFSYDFQTFEEENMF